MLLISLMMALQAQAMPPKYAFEEPAEVMDPAGVIEAIMLHPLFRGHFTCGDHEATGEGLAGDALGTDCQVVATNPGGFRALYRTDGLTNEDWHSWGAEVLSPTDGVVIGLLPGKSVNQPGTKGRPPAGAVQIRRDDGVTVMLGHLDGFRIALGQRVVAGQPIAKVGNNGPSFAPHVHIGAARGNEPLQIRWDQKAMARVRRASSERG